MSNRNEIDYVTKGKWIQQLKVNQLQQLEGNGLSNNHKWHSNVPNWI